MRLVWYEWEKIWKNASVLKIFLFFLILSSGVFWGELKKNQEWIPEYLKMHQEVDEKNREDAAKWLTKKKEDLQQARHAQQKALEQIEEEINAICNYDEYRESIQNQYEQSQEIAVFADANEHQEGDRKRIAKIYQKLQIKAPMKLQPYFGVRQLLNFYAGDLLAVIFLIYLVSVVFIQEEKSGKTAFAFTMLRGKGSIFIAKVLTVYGGLVIYLVLTFFLNLIVETLTVGSIAYTAAIQSIPEFCSVPYPWRIGQYMIGCVGLKLIAALILIGIAVMLAKRSGSEILTAVGTSGMVGISIWAYEFFYENGWQATVRLWNIWSFLRGQPVIGNYELIELGNVSIEVVWGLVLGVLIGFILLLVSQNGVQRERKRKVRKKRERKQIPHTLFYYEMKKMWIYQGGIFLFTACVLLQGMTVFQYRDYFGTEEYYYQQYIDSFGDQITEQTGEKIAKEEERFQKIQKKLAIEENADLLVAWSNQLECYSGFEKYVNRVELLKQDDKAEILLKDAQYGIMFSATEVSRMMVMLLCFSFAFLIPALFQKEKETRVEVLQKTAVCGGRCLWDRKIGTLLCYIISFILLSNIFSFWKANTKYQLKLQAPLDCLAEYWSYGIKLPIVVFFVIGVLLQCIGAAVVVVILAACGQRVKNQYMLSGVILGGSVIPTLLSPYSSGQVLRSIHDFLFVFTVENVLLMLLWITMLVIAVLVAKKERRDT